ncbi:hypothetical protein RUM4293_00895 [Ruegeria atlantica]|uniref:Uncharacterized protein n=1 Tax=Ruegeria atlantica TaxID=81569 RepID=A0A0P1EM75_9RHOB|nr:hypothetical protein RUM4293_00895 [Ruegeria atlantica]
MALTMRDSSAAANYRSLNARSIVICTGFNK